MGQFWKKKEFSILEKKWYEKLLLDNFNDIEEEKNGNRYLKQYSSDLFKQRSNVYTAEQRDQKMAFFDLVKDAINKDNEMPSLDRFVLINYSNGIKQKDILNKLKEGGIKCHRITVIRIISSYLRKWRIPTQRRLNLKTR